MAIVFADAGRVDSMGDFSGVDPAVCHDMLLTNVYGARLTRRHTLASVKAVGGHVVLVGSAAGRAAIAGSMDAASKWAVTGMAYNPLGEGARVSLLEPGMVNTPFFDEPP